MSETWRVTWSNTRRIMCRRGEGRGDVPSPCSVRAAASRAPAAADGDVLPARRRRGHGLFGLLGAHPARGRGQRHRLPRQVPRLRRGRPRVHARAVAPRAGDGPAGHAAAAAGQLRDARRGADPRHRRRGQRRPPLARRRADPVPGRRGDEARAGPARRGGDRPAAEAHPRPAQAHRPGADARRRRDPADLPAARPRHVAGDRLHARVAAARRGRAGAPSARRRRRSAPSW